MRISKTATIAVLGAAIAATLTTGVSTIALSPAGSTTAISLAGTPPGTASKNAYSSYSGTIRASDDTPSVGQRVTLSAAFMGLNANAAYGAKAHRTLLAWARPIGTNVWQLIGTVRTSADGVWTKRVTFNGPTEYAVTYGGSAQFRPFVSAPQGVG